MTAIVTTGLWVKFVYSLVIFNNLTICVVYVYGINIDNRLHARKLLSRKTFQMTSAEDQKDILNQILSKVPERIRLQFAKNQIQILCNFLHLSLTNLASSSPLPQTKTMQTTPLLSRQGRIVSISCRKMTVRCIRIAVVSVTPLGDSTQAEN